MKKLTLITTGLMLFLCTSVFANEGEKKSKKETSLVAGSFGGVSVTVSKEISKSFTSKFSGGEDVKWKQREEFFFADFKVNQKDMFAAYSAKGELLGVSRSLLLTELPMHVEMSIRDNYKDYKIDNVITEMVFDGETTYHLQVENKTRYLKLKCDSQGHISIAKRTKKKLIGSVY